MPYSNEYVKKEEQTPAPTSTTKVEQQWSVWDYPPAPNQGPGTPLATPVATPSTTPANSMYSGSTGYPASTQYTRQSTPSTTPANSMYSGSTGYPASTQYTRQSTPGVSPAVSTSTRHSSSVGGWRPSWHQAAPAAPVNQQKPEEIDYREFAEPAPNQARKRAKPNYSDW
ncbi:hypothetical protein Hte_006364 [Hypoxylon texense]